MDSKTVRELYKKASPLEQPLEPAEGSKKFNKIRQGIATNTLTKISPNNAVITENKIKKTVTLTQGDTSLTLPAFLIDGLKTSTYQLLDVLVGELTDTGAKSPTTSISLAEYMAKRKLKDRKTARVQAEADLEELYNASISFVHTRKNSEPKDFKDIRIISSKGIERGVIGVTFGMDFYKVLLSYPVMDAPAQLLSINSKKNPNSYYFIRKIAEHKNMNVGKPNEDILGVSTLLDIAPFIPKYEEVKKKDRAVTRTIIDRFERDMNALADTLTWEYCHSKGKPLTEKELNNFTYDLFSSLFIKTTWHEYPDQTARLERKAERIEKAKKKKEKLEKEVTKEVAKAKAKKIVEEEEEKAKKERKEKEEKRKKE